MLRLDLRLLLSLSCVFWLVSVGRTQAVDADRSTTEEAPSSTSTAPAKTHTVDVGNADHKFKPDIIQAEIGDIVEFRFFPPNHSVVRAEYLYPCIPYEMTGRNKDGFFSGFNPVDVILEDVSPQCDATSRLEQTVGKIRRR